MLILHLRSRLFKIWIAPLFNGLELGLTNRVICYNPGQMVLEQLPFSRVFVWNLQLTALRRFPSPLNKVKVLKVYKICKMCLTWNTQYCLGGGSTWITFSSPETQSVPNVLTRIKDRNLSRWIASWSTFWTTGARTKEKSPLNRCPQIVGSKDQFPRTLHRCNETWSAEHRIILVTVPAHTIVFMVSYTRKGRFNKSVLMYQKTNLIV